MRRETKNRKNGEKMKCTLGVAVISTETNGRPWPHTHTQRRHAQVDPFGARGCGCRGNKPERPTSYLAVSSAVHVKDDLSLILGAVGPRGAVGGNRGLNIGKVTNITSDHVRK